VTGKKNTTTLRRTNKKQTLPIWVWVGLGAILLVGLFAAFFMQPASAGKMTAEINVIQAAEKRTAGAFILDIREQHEWNEVHIPDATLIPLGQLESRLNEIPRDQDIVVVCRSGNRSATGRDILLRAGFENVTSMAGGMNDWQAHGFPTIGGR